MEDASAFGALCPAQPESVCGPVVFPLDRILLAAVVEAEDFVVEIEELCHDADAPPFGDEVAYLGVDLGVRVDVGVGLRSLEPAGSGIGWGAEDGRAVLFMRDTAIQPLLIMDGQGRIKMHGLGDGVIAPNG